MAQPPGPNPTLDVGPDGIGRIVFDDPFRDVNILSREVMEAFALCLAEAADRARSGELRAIVLWSGKPTTFLAGADVGDIEEIADPAVGEAGCRLGQRLFQELEDLPVPSLAAIHGVCLGGGLELALACTHRIASDAEETRLGFPEILLGILPAWGGTTRLPRLIGLREASRMILSGKRYSSPQALSVGLVDGVLPTGDFQALALEWARRMMREPASSRNPGRHRDASVLDRTALGRRLVLRTARRKVKARTRGHYPAPERVLEVLRASESLSLPEAFALEARTAGDLIASPESKNLIHLFHLREDARKGRGIPEEVLALPRHPLMDRIPDGDLEGMIHRVLEPYLSEARALVGEGVGRGRIDSTARAFGMERGPFDLLAGVRLRGSGEKGPNPEIRDRLILPMVAAAAAVLEEGRVSRAGEIDLALIIGAGFPPFRGGLLRYADQSGLPGLVTRLNEFAHRLGPRFKPGPLLLDLARTGESFYSRFP